MTIRIIPRIDIKGPNLVKGIHLEGLRVLGKPENFARYYYENGADELSYMDVVATLFGRNSLNDIVRRTAKDIFIPLCVGGGLRNVDDIRSVLRAGADKVSINTAAISNPNFITEAAQKFGSSTIVVSIEVIRQPDGQYHCFTDCGREATGVELRAWASRVAQLGAGEICITSVDREGTGRGFDLELVRSVANLVSIPVIAHGGAGSSEDVIKCVKDGNADAVSVASLLHYEAIKNFDLDTSDYQSEGNIEFIKKDNRFSKIQEANISTLKNKMASSGLFVRPAENNVES